MKTVIVQNPKRLLGRQPVAPQKGTGLNAGHVAYTPAGLAQKSVKGYFLRQPVPK